MAKERIKESFARAIKKHKERSVIMVEVPAESYFEANSDFVKLLTAKSFEGIYISFQRPFKNIFFLFKQKGINLNKLLLIDVAALFAGEMQEKNPRCVHISPNIDINELVRAIYTSLSKLKSKKRFIFIDSLTTITLYKPLSETLRFSEFLIRTVRKYPVQNVSLIFNVAKGLAQKKFIRDIALHVDDVISIAK
jgi:KaiC/GvpD/RAD55 family RecA-like ATPase